MALRVVKAGELYSTFIYDGKDCADMGIYNVTNGAVYTMNIEPDYNDKTLEVPAYDGKYYYGTQITGQRFVFNCFCHDLSSKEYNKMRAWLNPRKVGRLILSDQQYKYYYVKQISVSNLSAIPLTSIQTPPNTLYGTTLFDDVVYTGNFTVTFETVGSAYGYGISPYDDGIIYDASTAYGRGYYYDSGLIYQEMAPTLDWRIPANAKEYPIRMYNPGSADGQPAYDIIPIDADAMLDKIFNQDDAYIRIKNRTTGTDTIIDLNKTNINTTVDTMSQIVYGGAGQDYKSETYYGRFTGTPLKLSPAEDVIELPATFVPWFEEVELIHEGEIGTGQWDYAQKDNLLKEYNSFTIQNNVVSVNPEVLQVTEDMVGKHFCVLYNGGAKITAVDVDNNTLTLDSFIEPLTGGEYDTYDIPGGTIENGVIIRPSGFEFNYVGERESAEVGDAGQPGQVCKVGDTFCVYMYGWWRPTSMFMSEDEFKDETGAFVPVYRNFGAVILDLDDLVITTNLPEIILGGMMTVRYL